MKTAAEILEKAAGFGDSSYNRWRCYVDHSEMAPSIDGKPVLVVEQQPALTDYDYRIRLEEIDPDFSYDRYFDELWNYILVRYTNTVGKEMWISPADDATLTDATSVADYGQRDYELKVDTVWQPQRRTWAGPFWQNIRTLNTA